jgi:outer membrane protein assembly factor BamB
MMENPDRPRGWRVFQVFLCLAFLALTAFFLYQAIPGATAVESAAHGGGSPGTAGGGKPGGLCFFGETAGELARTPVSVLLPAWSRRMEGRIYMAAHGDTLYLASSTGQISAMDVSSGRTRWSLNLGAAVCSAPAVQEGVVYACTTNRLLYALDAQSGALLWYFSCQGVINSQPSVGGRRVYLCADNDSVFNLVQHVYALDARSGALLWLHEMQDWTPSPPAVGLDAVYLAGFRRRLTALDKRNGTTLWTAPSSSIVLGPPRLVGDLVVYHSIDGWVRAVDARNGTLEWSLRLPGWGSMTADESTGTLYILAGGNRLYALSASEGAFSWTYTESGLLSCNPAGGLVYLFSGSGDVYLLDPATGMEKAVFLLPHPPASTPLVTGDSIIVPSADGWIHAYRVPPRENPPGNT